jgi:hypothetical protein
MIETNTALFIPELAHCFSPVCEGSFVVSLIRPTAPTSFCLS